KASPQAAGTNRRDQTAHWTGATGLLDWEPLRWSKCSASTAARVFTPGRCRFQPLRAWLGGHGAASSRGRRGEAGQVAGEVIGPGVNATRLAREGIERDRHLVGLPGSLERPLVGKAQGL